MTRFGFVGAATFAILTSSSAIAQSSGVPAEFPPASFTGNQFVDSNGCAFIRAGISGTVNWVPRVDRRRNQLCNFQPTFDASETVAAAPATPAPRVAPLDAPIIEITAPPPEPRRPLGGLLNRPIETVAAIPAAVAPTTPQVIEAPAPVEIAAPEPVAAPEPRVTLAEACDGRFGVQPGFISARTGDPIDCGPAPQVAAAPAPAPVVAPAPIAAPEPARITLAQACDGRFGVQPGFISASTGDPIDCGPAPQVAAAPVPAPVIAPTRSAPEPRRITLAQACAEIGTTGARYISASTGEPIVISCKGGLHPCPILS